MSFYTGAHYGTMPAFGLNLPSSGGISFGGAKQQAPMPYYQPQQQAAPNVSSLFKSMSAGPAMTRTTSSYGVKDPWTPVGLDKYINNQQQMNYTRAQGDMSRAQDTMAHQGFGGQSALGKAMVQANQGQLAAQNQDAETQAEGVARGQNLGAQQFTAGAKNAASIEDTRAASQQSALNNAFRIAQMNLMGRSA